MPRIDYVRSSEDGKTVKIAVITDEDRVVYTVGGRLYSRLGGFSRGEEISEDTLLQIRAEHNYRAAKRKALNILAYADNNERTLAMKLIRGGTDKECAKEVLRHNLITESGKPCSLKNFRRHGYEQLFVQSV